MIRGNLGSLVHNFFLHIEINTLNLPYWKLPRPHRANPVSKVLRFVFEKNWIRRLLGINLATAMILIPLSGQMANFTLQEPTFEVSATDLAVGDVSTSVVTKPREFVSPVTDYRYVSQRFRSGHAGYDITSQIGAQVVAFTSGRVHQIESGTFGLGKYIVLDHGHGLVSVYGHLRSFDVRVGDHVKTGEKIGEVGMTGYTTGPHVHFEVHDSGRAVNPGVYLDI